MYACIFLKPLIFVVHMIRKSESKLPEIVVLIYDFNLVLGPSAAYKYNK